MIIMLVLILSAYRFLRRVIKPTVQINPVPPNTHIKRDIRVPIALRPHAPRFRRGEQLKLEIRDTCHYKTSRLRSQFPAAYQPSPSGTRPIRDTSSPK